MYSKNEASALKTKFWTAFGSYLKPVHNAVGQRINWVNYKTGVKHIFLRMDVDKREARIGLECRHSEAQDRLAVFQKLVLHQKVLADLSQTNWTWSQEVYDDFGRPISRIQVTLPNVNIFNQQDWPVIISFLKEQVLILDAFWWEIKDFIEP